MKFLFGWLTYNARNMDVIPSSQTFDSWTAAYQFILKNKMSGDLFSFDPESNEYGLFMLTHKAKYTEGRLVQ